MLALSIAAVSFLAPASRLAAPSRTSTVQMAKGNDAVNFKELDGSNVRVGIIKARWHEDIIDDLIAGAQNGLAECGVPAENIIISEVPGSFELPLATRYLALSGTVDVIIPMGVLIKGDTYHFEVIADTVTSSLMSIGLQTGARRAARTRHEPKAARKSSIALLATARTLAPLHHLSHPHACMRRPTGHGRSAGHLRRAHRQHRGAGQGSLYRRQ